MNVIKLAAAAVVFVLLIIYAMAGMTHIEAGEVGILVKNWGDNRGMQKQVLGIGTTWIEPWRYDVVVYDARCRQMQEQPEEIKASTGDGQPTLVDFTLEICLEAAEVPNLHVTMGSDYYSRRVHPRLLGILKNMVPSKSSNEIYTSKGRLAVEAAVNEEMAKVFSESGIRATLNLRDIVFTNPDYVKLIERKAGAEQKVGIATRDAEAAQATAVGVVNTAEGEKQRRIKVAEAAREEQRLIGEGSRLRNEETAKGNLAIALADAKGVEAKRQALEGAGGERMVQLEWAKNLGPNVKVWGIPTGAPGTSSFMDLNGVLKGAFKGE